MAKRGFLRWVADKASDVAHAVTAPFRKAEKAPSPPPTPTPKPEPKPFTIRSADADARAQRQQKLRAKRKQREYRNKRTEISSKRAPKLPTVHETAAHIVRTHHAASSSQKLRIMRRVRYMTEEQRRQAVMMNADQLADAARDQYPDQEDAKGNKVNPFWYH